MAPVEIDVVGCLLSNSLRILGSVHVMPYAGMGLEEGSDVAFFLSTSLMEMEA